MIYEQYQHAFYAHDEDQVEEIKDRLGLSNAEWVEDIASGRVRVRGGESADSVAHLRFCYGFPLEIEILTYLEGPHWHMDKKDWQDGRPFVSHIGFHMKPGEHAPRFDPIPAQTMRTFKHTNPYLIERKRTFRYEIFDRLHHGVAAALGCDIKYIWRIEG